VLNTRTEVQCFGNGVGLLVVSWMMGIVQGRKWIKMRNIECGHYYDHYERSLLSLVFQAFDQRIDGYSQVVEGIGVQEKSMCFIKGGFNRNGTYMK